MTAWIIRAGRHGEREQWALSQGLAGAGFHEVPDMGPASSKAKVRAMVNSAYSAAPLGRQANFAGQLWALRGAVKPGDLIVMPMKTSKRIAIGICTSGYSFRTDESDADSRHTIAVDWKVTDIPRSAIKDDLLNTINGAMTIFQASKNNAEARLRQVMETGTDPGSASVAASPAAQRATATSDGADVVDPDPAPTLEAIRDRVRTHLIENFKGHRLTELIASILRVEGYTCDVSPPGPDQGVDIIAGRGPLGLDSPTLIAEVKSEEGAIGSTVVRGLQGAMTQHRADQGLLVAWGGLNKQARTEIRTDRLTMRVWEADDIIDHLFDAYDRLPDDVRMAIPLKRTWVLDQETG